MLQIFFVLNHHDRVGYRILENHDFCFLFPELILCKKNFDLLTSGVPVNVDLN